MKNLVSASYIVQAIRDTEIHDTDGTNRRRVTYEYLTDMMRLNEEAGAVEIKTFTRILGQQI